MSAPHSGWRRMTAHSASSSGPGFRRIVSGTPSLPTSWRRAASSRSVTPSLVMPRRSPNRRPPRPDPARERAYLRRMAARVVVAHIHRAREDLDRRGAHGLRPGPQVALLERARGELRELRQELEPALAEALARDHGKDAARHSVDDE